MRNPGSEKLRGQSYTARQRQKQNSNIGLFDLGQNIRLDLTFEREKRPFHKEGPVSLAPRGSHTQAYGHHKGLGSPPFTVDRAELL